MKKVLAVLIVLAITGLVGWRVYQVFTTDTKPNHQRRKAPPVPVETTQVRRSAIRDVVRFSGSLAPKSYFVVSPKITGRLEKLHANIGDVVKRGQLIAVLDDDEYSQQVEQVKAELDVAKANIVEQRSALEVAKREFERTSTLRLKKIASESELDASRAQFEAAEAKYRVAQAQVVQKEAALNAAKVRLSYTKIQASWKNGDERRIVGERFVDEGEMLKANDPIVSIIEINSLTAVIHIIERDYAHVKPGQEAVVTTDAYPGKTFTGKVIRVAPLLKETSRQARVEIEVPNPDQMLKPGMFARVQIEFASRDNATVIPVSALVKREQRQGVFMVEAGNSKARFIPVMLGIVNGDWAEVVDPELSGQVITMGHHLLDEGSDIILPEARQKGASGPKAGGGSAAGGRTPRQGERR